jgi:hypothetical protein
LQVAVGKVRILEGRVDLDERGPDRIELLTGRFLRMRRAEADKPGQQGEESEKETAEARQGVRSL